MLTNTLQKNYGLRKIRKKDILFRKRKIVEEFNVSIKPQILMALASDMIRKLQKLFVYETMNNTKLILCIVEFDITSQSCVLLDADITNVQNAIYQMFYKFSMHWYHNNLSTSFHFFKHHKTGFS